MRKLERPPAPSGLEKAKKTFSNWDEFCRNDQSIHAAVSNTLQNNMQNGHCAYCEDKVAAGKGHIEHFRKRADHPQLTFVWDNLYYSCGKPESCGKHKDKLPTGSYRYDELIAPCADNPEDFLTFALDGAIIPIEKNVSAENRRRAETTIRVFNLNDTGLKERRRAQWQRFLKLARNRSAREIDVYLDLWKNEPFITMLYHRCGKRTDGADFSVERVIKRKR